MDVLQVHRGNVRLLGFGVKGEWPEKTWQSLLGERLHKGRIVNMIKCSRKKTKWSKQRVLDLLSIRDRTGKSTED